MEHAGKAQSTTINHTGHISDDGHLYNRGFPQFRQWSSFGSTVSVSAGHHQREWNICMYLFLWHVSAWRSAWDTKQHSPTLAAKRPALPRNKKLNIKRVLSSQAWLHLATSGDGVITTEMRRQQQSRTYPSDLPTTATLDYCNACAATHHSMPS